MRRTPRSQQGLAAVEFAVVLSFALLVLFSCLEISRLFFAYNAVAEITRRTARVAVVTGGTAAAAKAATDYGDKALKNFSASNVSITYSNETGGTPTSAADTAFVTVSITGYQHALVVPLFGTSAVTIPPFTTTLPVESQGL